MERKCSSCANCEYRDDGEILVTDACAKCNWVVVGGNKVPSNWKAKPKTNADRMIEVLKTNDVASFLDWWEEIFEDGIPSADYFEWWLKQPAEGENHVQ